MEKSAARLSLLCRIGESRVLRDGRTHKWGPGVEFIEETGSGVLRSRNSVEAATVARPQQCATRRTRRRNRIRQDRRRGIPPSPTNGPQIGNQARLRLSSRHMFAILLASASASVRRAVPTSSSASCALAASASRGSIATPTFFGHSKSDIYCACIFNRKSPCGCRPQRR